MLPRLEEDYMPKMDDVYTFRVARGAPAVCALGPPVACAAAFCRSVVDSDDEGVGAAGGGLEALPVGALHETKPDPETGDRLVYDGESFGLEPGDGAWVPVSRSGSDGSGCEQFNPEVVLQAAGAVTDVAPGMWVPGAKEGLVFVANTTEFDQVV